MSEFNTGLPSIRQVQQFVQKQQEVEVKVVTGDLLVGKIRWQDANCLCLVDHYEQLTLVWRQALIYVKPKA
jgi:host factor-I protein